MREITPAGLFVAVFLASPTAATTRPVSWGKPGVSMDTYRKDAIECGSAGYFHDVSDTEAAKVFKDATSKLNANESDLQSLARASNSASTLDIVTQSSQIVQAVQPDKRLDEVRSLQYDVVSRCLKDRGYVQFKLSREQLKQLSHYKVGSPERHYYLYRLSVDPKIVEDQRY